MAASAVRRPCQGRRGRRRHRRAGGTPRRVPGAGPCRPDPVAGRTAPDRGVRGVCSVHGA
ncbi:hypothetical protein E5N77_02400 [Streptomyces sp. SS52]|nr:hypothetical protein E5N77_02400 [Streptomyces sp. SS52]